MDAAFGRCALLGKYPVVIAVEWLRLLAGAIAQSLGHIGQRAQRTWRLAFWHFPVQTVLLARVTQEFLRVLFGAAVGLLEVLVLRTGNIGKHIDGNQFIVADPSRQDFFLAACGVKGPPASVI